MTMKMTIENATLTNFRKGYKFEIYYMFIFHVVLLLHLAVCDEINAKRILQMSFRLEYRNSVLVITA